MDVERLKREKCGEPKTAASKEEIKWKSFYMPASR